MATVSETPDLQETINCLWLLSILVVMQADGAPISSNKVFHSDFFIFI